MTEKQYPDLTQIIRDVGGIVHSDGNIFFKDADVFMVAADRAMRGVGLPEDLVKEAYRLAAAMPIAGDDENVFRWAMDAASLLYELASKKAEPAHKEQPNG